MHTSQIDVLEIIWYQNTCRNQKDSLSETTEAHKASASSHEGACPAFCLCSVVSRALCFRALCTQGANNTIMPWNTPTFSILNTFYKTEKTENKRATLKERDVFELFRSPKAKPTCTPSIAAVQRCNIYDDNRVQSDVNLDEMVLEWKYDCKCARKAISGYSRGLAARLINLETLLKPGVAYPSGNHITAH